MTVLTRPGENAKAHQFDPDSYRMTLGEHLEELRTRMILGLAGFVLAAIVCMIFGEQVIWIFCRPLIHALLESGMSPQIYYKEVADPFLVYMEISLITAGVIASPWMLYQLWQFVAAGLYPRERKYITKYLPLSIGLLLSGVATLYFLVLPISLLFFIHFGSTLPLHLPESTTGKQIVAKGAAPGPAVQLPAYHGNPEGKLSDGQMWIDADQNRLKIFFNGEVHGLPFEPTNLAAPIITLPDYISMVVGLLIAFALAFQLPLAVMALVRVGILDIEWLKKMRRYVYFAMACVAAVIIPDVITGMVALMIPLILLYELGLWLAARKPPIDAEYDAVS
jgi:sec-independent protein translocase protein TatC